MKIPSSPRKTGLKILIIRRDNIGDLVCNTPMFRALRQRFPDALLCALVNSYNAPVLENNPDVDRVYAYTKAKHKSPGTSALRVYWDRLRMFAQLRQEQFDYAILAGAHFLPRALRLARMIKPRHIIGFTETGRRGVQHIDIAIPYSLPQPMHEVQDVFRLLAPLGIEEPPPQLCLAAPPEQRLAAKHLLEEQQWPPFSRLVGIHISARKISQRWDAQNFIALMRQLRDRHHAAFMLFWSPGSETNPHHPGDDEKAAEILRATSDLPVLAYPTHHLRELIGGLSLCDMVICSDGGAMHLAAGLGKPILCFFGKSDATRWHPWGVPYVVLQPRSLDVANLTVDEALNGYKELVSFP
jgi:heptosyltransferase-3